jgi:hypothetical protein
MAAVSCFWFLASCFHLSKAGESLLESNCHCVQQRGGGMEDEAYEWRQDQH